MMAKANLLSNSFDERWKKYRAQLKICKREFSEEAVHDLRVATRRLLAVLDLLRALDPHPRIQKVRRALKNQLDEFDDLRDVQVMLVDVSEAVSNFPELKPFEKALQEREKRLLRKARKQIKESKSTELEKRVEKIHLSVREKSSGARFNKRLLEAVDNAYLRAMQAYGQVEASQSATIHRLRIVFKKFRYMVEIAHPFLKKYPEPRFERMHEYQSRMGLIQDIEILLATLADFGETAASTSDFETVRRYFEKRLAESLSAYLADKDEILAFWRAAPDQPFPWEKKHAPLRRSSRNRRGGGNARLRRRQPADAHGQGPQEDDENRAGVEGTGGEPGSDPDQPVPASDPNSDHPEEDVQPQEG
jgi:CHAD domain-containing protein